MIWFGHRHFVKDEDQLSSKGKYGELLKTEDLFQGNKDIPHWSFISEWNGFLICVYQAWDRFMQTNYYLWENNAHPHHLCCCYSGSEKVRVAHSSAACHSIRHSYGALCLVAQSKEGAEYVGTAGRQTGIPTGILSAVTTCGCFETICPPPDVSLQTDQHIGSMDECGLEHLWEIQSNSINTSSHYILLLTVLRELK